MTGISRLTSLTLAALSLLAVVLLLLAATFAVRGPASPGSGKTIGDLAVPVAAKSDAQLSGRN